MKSCPFCGGAAEIWPKKILAESYHSECQACGATGHSHVGCTVEQAIAAWNQRVGDVDLERANAEIERLLAWRYD
jgi:Lar family restriction alleviation protein